MGVAVAPAADGLKVTPVAQQILHQHGVHIHCTEIIFKDAHIVPLFHQIPDILPQKCGLACPQKAGDQVYLYHIKSTSRAARFRLLPVYRIRAECASAGRFFGGRPPAFS